MSRPRLNPNSRHPLHPNSLCGPLLGVYAAGALLSFLYTAWPFQLKCRALGDVVVYLCFGPLLFQFTALLVASPASPNYRGGLG